MGFSIQDTTTLAKPFYKSWTIIFNAIAFLVVVINQFIPFLQLIPFSDPTISKNASDLVFALLTLLNIILRFRTTVPVTGISIK